MMDRPANGVNPETVPKKTGIEITRTRRESDQARVYEAAK